MIIVKVKNASSIEQALKQYKFKVYKTKQTEKLRERQEFTKKSVKKRSQVNKAIYLQRKRNEIS
jgi:small subunit ribosomal protein S21